MSRCAVYFVKNDCPAPYLVAIHGAIAEVNKSHHGKKKVDVLRYVELNTRDSHGLYEAVIIASSYVTLNEFDKAAKARNCAEALEYKHPDYPGERFHFEIKGDGRADIWVAPEDACVHLTGEDVCQRRWNIRGYSPAGMFIKEVVFVGPNVAVRNALRRYKHAAREVRESWRYKLDGKNTGGMTEQQWGKISDALGCWGAMYLFTSEGTVIKVTRKEMNWVRPTTPEGRQFYTRMVHNGYIQIPLPTVLREYDRSSCARRTLFEDSVVTMALTHDAEATRH